ncbi:sugar-binding transcriptional regulator [Erwinia oleae]|uniref:sugar-binding transcriptional regulator n=1 Tax=Erwinia oleae TaxID=796334 RepID=UPI000A06E33B|nr:sugar-binding transcriptional regulator [Erwinia oleae]
MTKSRGRTDLSARAAWMYYIGGQTQYEIADNLGISRQVVQRLIATASAENLVSFQIVHRISDCATLASALAKKYDLQLCKVVPSATLDNNACQQMIASAAAEVMYRMLMTSQDFTVALGSGRTLRSAIEKMPELIRPQHSCVSLIGAMTADGTTTRYDVPLLMAGKTQGKYFILPAPMFADTPQDRELWCQHRIYKLVTDKARTADATFLGIGEVSLSCPLCLEGFVSTDEMQQQLEEQATAEIIGHIINREGKRLSNPLQQRLTSAPVAPDPVRPTIAFAGGRTKHRAIRAALRGRWINGLVTDEETARYLLELNLSEGAEPPLQEKARFGNKKSLSPDG